MKRIFLLIAPFALTLASCGPNKSQLRAELQSIDHEMVILRNAAYQYQSQMGRAEFASLIGSFATGYGTTSGDYNLAEEGAGTLIDAAGSYDSASFSLEQIKQRQSQLNVRRSQILRQLN